MRKNIRRGNTKNKIIIISSILFVLFFMAVGYSSLYQQLEISGEANLYSSQKYLWHKIINEYDSTHSGSFYESELETGKYSYVGNGSANYISLDSELWRIVSVESDHTIKVVKADTTLTRAFDTANNRTAASTYCITPEYGCNSWSSQESFNDLVVDNNSSLLTYLNTTFYNSLSSGLKSKIVLHDFNVGTVADNSTITAMVTSEEQLTWNGYIGLLSLSEFITPSNPSASSTVPGNYSNNYLLSYGNERLLWTITPASDNSSNVWVINYDGTQVLKKANKTSEEVDNNTYYYTVFPTMYLSSSVRYSSGNGSSGNPFTIQ